MSDTFETNRARLEEFRDRLKYVEGATGLAVAVGNKVVALDLFDKPVTCGRVWDRLLSGVVMDALEESPIRPACRKGRRGEVDLRLERACLGACTGSRRGAGVPPRSRPGNACLGLDVRGFDASRKRRRGELSAQYVNHLQNRVLKMTCSRAAFILSILACGRPGQHEAGRRVAAAVPQGLRSRRELENAHASARRCRALAG